MIQMQLVDNLIFVGTEHDVWPQLMKQDTLKPCYIDEDAVVTVIHV
jgi:hypothetical protein